MQKKLIAFAVAGIVSGSAFAQTSTDITVYGRADYGFMQRTGDLSNAAAKKQDGRMEFASGIQAGSRVGLKGAEDLGDGMKAIFQFEFGLGMDQSTGLNSTRNSYVGLTGGFGTLVGGRLDGVRYGIFNKYDAFAGGTVGNFTQITAQVDRANNALAYISPKMGGVTVTLATATHIGNSNPLGLAADESGAIITDNPAPTDADPVTPADVNAATAGKGNNGDARLLTAMVNFNQGALDLTADWEQVKFKEGAASTAGGGVPGAVDNVQVMTLGASYDLGVAKIRGLYDQLKVDARVGGTVSKVESWFLSATVPIGSKVNLKATYGESEDKEVAGDAKVTKFGIGADYNLSKRTNFYADFGNIKNGAVTAFGISPAANGLNSAANLYGESGFDFGIAHKF